MGLTRKTMSLFTMGAVDFRSDKERTAAYTRGTRRQTRKQTKILKHQSRTQRAKGLFRALRGPQTMGAPAVEDEDEQWRAYRAALAEWEAEQWRVYRVALAEWKAQQGK
jgi:hypothetical protein